MPESTTRAKIVIMAGGTGGHIFPALSIAEVLQQEHHAQVCFLGSMKGMEHDLVGKAGFKLYTVTAERIYGAKLFKVVWSSLHMLFALIQAVRLFRRIQPELVISMGGFVAAPGGLAARLLRIPLVIHEQNAVAGMTNRLLVRFAHTVLQAFPDVFAAKYHPQLVGNPVRQNILSLPAPASRYASRTGDLRILIIGGSQGALMLNRLLPCVFRKLDQPLDIWHQTGINSLELTRQFYQKLGIKARIEAFIDDMAEAYAWADFVICRAGALTTSELYVVGLPALFIPFPHAVYNHQYYNARPMVKLGAALCIEQKQATVNNTAEQLQQFLLQQPDSRTHLLARAVKARTLAFPKAHTAIAQLCMDVLLKRKTDRNSRS